MIEVAIEILKRAPELLTARNVLGETPLFRAVRYGKDEMFDLLVGELDRRKSENEEGRKDCLRRNDGTTILHILIFSENFGELPDKEYELPDFIYFYFFLFTLHITSILFWIRSSQTSNSPINSTL